MANLLVDYDLGRYRRMIDAIEDEPVHKEVKNTAKVILEDLKSAPEKFLATDSRSLLCMSLVLAYLRTVDVADRSCDPYEHSDDYFLKIQPKMASIIEKLGPEIDTLEGKLYFIDAMYDFRYVRYHADIPPPYLWAKTSLEMDGIYRGDGVFDPTGRTTGCGAAPLLMEIERLRITPAVKRSVDGVDAILRKHELGLGYLGVPWKRGAMLREIRNMLIEENC